MSDETSRATLEWAPDIPSAWDVVNLRMLARIFAGGTPDRKNVDYWSDGTVPWLNSGSVNDWAISTPSELIAREALANGATRWAPKGSVLVALAGQGKTKGMAARLEIDSTLNQSLAAIVPGPSLDYRFLQYWLTSNYLNIRGLAGGDLRDGLNLQHIGSIQVPRPPVEEQRAIADFLDRETAQIDAFIAKNEELVALLTERRAAVIGYAVTRGTETTVPLKASNVEWLGDVPVHWTIAGLARFAKTVSGSGFPENEQGVEGADIAFYKVNALGQADADGVIRSSWDTISHETAKALRAKVLPPGTILLAKIGAALLLGRIRRTDRVACIDNNMMAIVPDQGLSTRFASYALQTFDFEALANPGTVPSMDMYALMHRETAIPPLPEQIAIADYLDRQLAEIDAALDASRRGIQLAGERRAALISAAVTGKIDVEEAA